MPPHRHPTLSQLYKKPQNQNQTNKPSIFQEEKQGKKNPTQTISTFYNISKYMYSLISLGPFSVLEATVPKKIYFIADGVYKESWIQFCFLESSPPF